MFTWGPRSSGDPLFGQVLLLLNGAGLTKDSSIYDRAMTAAGALALNTANPYLGFPTYDKPQGNNWLELVVSDSWVAGNLTSGEWCLETRIKPLAATGSDGTFCSFGPLGLAWNADGSTVGRVFNWSSSSVAVASSSGVLSVGSWGHVAMIRDNTTDPSFGVLRLFLEGVEVGTAGGQPKAGSLGGAGLGRPIGISSAAHPMAIAGLRLTMGTRRYLTNAQGAPVNTFTPDAYPFQT